MANDSSTETLSLKATINRLSSANDSVVDGGVLNNDSTTDPATKRGLSKRDSKLDQINLYVWPDGGILRTASIALPFKHPNR